LVTTVPESKEAVEVDPELAHAAPVYESRRTELPVATPVKATGQVVAAQFVPQSVPLVITEYQYVEGPASAEELLRSIGPKASSPRAAQRLEEVVSVTPVTHGSNALI